MEEEHENKDILSRFTQLESENLPVPFPGGIAEFVRAHLPRGDILLPSEFRLGFIDQTLFQVVFRMGPFHIVLGGISEEMRMVDVIISGSEEVNEKGNYNKTLTVASVRSHPLLGGWWVPDFFVWKSEIEELFSKNRLLGYV
ncbi:MAG: hypothetical protein PHS44_06320 [Candidatus Dojkabacteria bacterium]|jgi:hypothetical protein|nr:hypothetical protein [Candidatus Dojkabacteria bacterium]